MATSKDRAAYNIKIGFSFQAIVNKEDFILYKF